MTDVAPSPGPQLDTNLKKQIQAAYVTALLNSPKKSVRGPTPGAQDEQQCSISQNSLQQCIFNNISVTDCGDETVTIKCDSSSLQNAVECASVDAAAKIAIQEITARGLTQDQINSVITVMKRAGLDDADTVPFPTALMQYFKQRCAGTQTSDQNVTFPDVVITGPGCTQQILAVNSLDQRAKCVLSSMQQLLDLAGLGDPQPIPPHAPPFTPIVIPVPWVIAIAFAIVIVLLLGAICGAAVCKHKASVFMSGPQARK